MPECDQQSYYTNDGGDASNETTYHGYLGVTADSDGKIVSYTNSDIKIDYLFSTAGFAQCDSRTSLADHADYHGTVQPDCSTKRDPAVCQPTGVSDHAPLYGELKGSASLAYQLRETSGVTATDSSANHHDGSLEPGVTWNTAEAAATFDGTGEITGPEAVLGTTYGFSISAWVKVAPGSSTVAAVSQDGTEISGFILWYEADDKTWRFGMPTGDTTGWRVDRAVSTSQAQPGVWTHLTGVHDQRNNLLTLYVNGRKAQPGGTPRALACQGSFRRRPGQGQRPRERILDRFHPRRARLRLPAQRRPGQQPRELLKVDAGIVVPLLGLLGIAVLYRVIRTAVAHGIADAEDKRRRKADRKH
nr:hypothetical protein GCM10020092_004310 [Actinoplanes digitatis]